MFRSVWVLLLALVFLIGAAQPAGADAPGPTDFQSQVVSIDPSVPGISLRMVGGDSFVVMEVDRGIQVTVIGYRGEPYLRVLTDGTVEENQLSPSKYLNEERFGESEIPSQADPDADPEWLVVDDDGSWAWHDHRTHWMIPQAPPGADRGEQILEGVIPLFVQAQGGNVQEVDVTIVSFWLADPSLVPALLGALAGVILAGLWLRAQWLRTRTRTRRTTQYGFLAGISLMFALAFALLFGIWQVRSLPPETGPSILLWLLPSLGLAAGLGVILGDTGRPQRRDKEAEIRANLRRAALGLLSGSSLLLWGVIRRGHLLSAVLPTNAPAGGDRFVTAAALVLGTCVAAFTVHALVFPSAGIENQAARERD